MKRFTEEQKKEQKELINQLYDKFYMNPVLKVVKAIEGQQDNSQTKNKPTQGIVRCRRKR
jgi:hypothetical protein